MKYPSIEQVEIASREKLAEWCRFLDSPGTSAIGRENFIEIMEEEVKVIKLIMERFMSLGGWNAEISKKISWDKPKEKTYGDFAGDEFGDAGISFNI